MKKFIYIIGMIFAVSGFIGCSSGSGNGNDKDTGVGPGNIEPITITVVADLKDNHKIKIQSEGEDDVLLSKGQCIRIEGKAQHKLVVSAEQDSVASQLCSNIDEDQTNDCKGSYNVVYKIADSETGANKLALESADRNESKECILLPPVYTITVVADLGNRTIKVQDKEKAKTLKEKGSCLKLKRYDFHNLQIDVGEGDENRQVLCSNRDAGNAVTVSCSEDTVYEADNIEIALFGRPPTPETVVLNPGTEYNNSANCKWFDE